MQDFPVDCSVFRSIPVPTNQMPAAPPQPSSCDTKNTYRHGQTSPAVAKITDLTQTTLLGIFTNRPPHKASNLAKQNLNYSLENCQTFSFSYFSKIWYVYLLQDPPSIPISKNFFSSLNARVYFLKILILPLVPHLVIMTSCKPPSLFIIT